MIRLMIAGTRQIANERSTSRPRRNAEPYPSCSPDMETVRMCITRLPSVCPVEPQK
jgi:hypothetical protein